MMKISTINLTLVNTEDSYLHPFIAYNWPQTVNLRTGFISWDGAVTGGDYNFYTTIKEMIDTLD